MRTRKPPPKLKIEKKKRGKIESPVGGPKPPDVADLERLECYYDTASKGYFVKASDGEFIPVNKEDMGTRLELTGLSNVRDGAPSQVKERLIEIQNDDYVRYAGPLAGWPAKRYDISGEKVLVTKSPTIIERTYGKDTRVKAFIERLLGERAVDLHAWLKIGYESLLAGNMRRAPVMCVVGERDQGKSFLVQQVIVPIFGGRQANPHQYMSSATSFNLDLIGSETLVLDDPGSDDRYGTRKRFGDAVKAFTGDQAPRCHGKGLDAMTLTPFWRVVITLNDELEDLQVLPPMTKSMGDKIVIIRTAGRGVDRSTAATEDFGDYAEWMREGLTDYLGWLERWKVPAELISDRWGTRARQDAEVVGQLRTFNPEEQLREFIHAEVVNPEDEAEYSSARLYKILTDKLSDVAMETRHLLRSPGSLSKYMGRLCAHYPKEFRQNGRFAGGGTTRWVILPRSEKEE